MDPEAQQPEPQPSVVQRYIADPLLLHGHKFDLRLYVCVTSFNPLEAFVYQASYRSLFFTHARCNLMNFKLWPGSEFWIWSSAWTGGMLATVLHAGCEHQSHVDSSSAL
jgi:Tubulin-tyrosine ligase family